MANLVSTKITVQRVADHRNMCLADALPQFSKEIISIIDEYSRLVFHQLKSAIPFRSYSFEDLSKTYWVTRGYSDFPEALIVCSSLNRKPEQRSICGLIELETYDYLPVSERPFYPETAIERRNFFQLSPQNELIMTNVGGERTLLQRFSATSLFQYDGKKHEVIVATKDGVVTQFSTTSLMITSRAETKKGHIICAYSLEGSLLVASLSIEDTIVDNHTHKICHLTHVSLERYQNGLASETQSFSLVGRYNYLDSFLSLNRSKLIVIFEEIELSTKLYQTFSLPDCKKLSEWEDFSIPQVPRYTLDFSISYSNTLWVIKSTEETEDTLILYDYENWNHRGTLNLGRRNHHLPSIGVFYNGKATLVYRENRLLLLNI